MVLLLVARSSGRGAHPPNRTNLQHGRGFYNHGRGQTSGMSFPYNRGLGEPFRGREGFGQGYQIVLKYICIHLRVPESSMERKEKKELENY